MKRSLLALALAGCGPGPHAAADAAVDAAPPTGDGPCGAGLFFTGELVDWDSSLTGFCGIFGATFTVHGDASRVDHTNPNGRFQLCVPDALATQVDIAPPAAASECTQPASTYAVPGMIVASHAVIASGQIFSARAFTVARAPAFGYDPTRAQVLVHVDGAPRAVSIGAASDPPQAFDGTAWAAGTSGQNVFFGNVDPAAGTVTVTAGGALGEGPAPLAAGTFSYVTVVAP